MLNKIILIGNVGQDPEIKALPNGHRVANFSLATTEYWKDKNGEKQICFCGSHSAFRRSKKI